MATTSYPAEVRIKSQAGDDALLAEGVFPRPARGLADRAVSGAVHVKDPYHAVAAGVDLLSGQVECDGGGGFDFVDVVVHAVRATDLSGARVNKVDGLVPSTRDEAAGAEVIRGHARPTGEVVDGLSSSVLRQKRGR